MSIDPFPTELSLGRDMVAVRHSQVRHPVQRRTPDKQLRRLSVKAARTNPFAEDHFHSKDLRLSQRAPMIACLALPLSPSFASDGTQVLIADMAFGFRVAVLPNLRSLLRRNRNPRSSVSQGVITVAAIVSSISTHLANLALNLREQAGKDLRVLKVIGCDDDSDKLKGCLVHAEMEFAPRAATRVTVLAHFPFAFAIELDACRIYYYVQRLGLAKARQLNFQRATTTAQRRVTGHAQLDTEQVEQRVHQSFGGPQRQAVDLFQSRHAEDSRVGVLSRLAALSGARRVVP